MVKMVELAEELEALKKIQKLAIEQGEFQSAISTASLIIEILEML